MNDESLGPFRRDGRTRFVTESRDDEAAQRALRTGATLELPSYLALLSLGPVAFAFTAASPWILSISALLLLIAWKSHQSFALARKTIFSQGARRVWVAEDGIFLDGVIGPARWDWDVVVGVRITGGHVIVQFASHEVVAMPVTGAEAERMVSFIRERTQTRLTDNPSRLLFLLAILYATSVAAVLVLIH